MNHPEMARPGEAMARCPLLLIDDNVDNLKLLERMLEWAGYANTRSCTSAREGLELLDTFHPDLIILDLMMPVMDGYAFLEKVREHACEESFLPILVFTADLTPEARTRALELGAADFLTKPGDALEIQLRIRNFLRMGRMHSELRDQNRQLEVKVKQRTEHLEIARREAVETLANTCEYRDDDSGAHARRVGDLSAGIAAELGLEPDAVEAIRLAAPLHDLGKIALPDSILFKPGKLTDEEYAVVKRHPGVGAALLRGKTSPLLQLAREISLYHHERWDGTGYDEGLAGEQIPRSARIVAVADAFDVMTHGRPYRKAQSRQDVLNEMDALAGTQFEPAAVAALHAYLDALERAERIAA